jgi:hypothetical protein
LLGFELGLRLGKLLLHFGNVDHRQHLTCLDVIADIDANIGQVSGDFGEEVRFFEGFEAGVGLETSCRRDAARTHNLDPRGAIRLC